MENGGVKRMTAVVYCGECLGHVANVIGSGRADIEQQTFNGMRCRAARCAGRDNLGVRIVEGES